MMYNMHSSLRLFWEIHSFLIIRKVLVQSVPDAVSPLKLPLIQGFVATRQSSVLVDVQALTGIQACCNNLELCSLMPVWQGQVCLKQLAQQYHVIHHSKAASMLCAANECLSAVAGSMSLVSTRYLCNKRATK